MAKSNGFDKIQFFDTKRMRGVAEREKSRFVVRVTEKGQDAKGRAFKKYSKSYTRLINDNFQKKSGGRLKAYQGFPVGGKTTKPVFALRGLTMSNFRVRKVVKDGFILGWNGEAAEIVDGNQKKGRDIVGIPDKEFNEVLKDLGLAVDKEFKKIPNRTVIRN